jgi:hypothetical protein
VALRACVRGGRASGGKVHRGGGRGSSGGSSLHEGGEGNLVGGTSPRGRGQEGALPLRNTEARKYVRSRFPRPQAQVGQIKSVEEGGVTVLGLSSLSKGTRDYSEVLSDTWGGRREGYICPCLRTCLRTRPTREAVDNNTPHVFECNARSN